MSHDYVYDPKKPNHVYWRPLPDTGSRAISYEKAVAQQGIILDRKHSIAMYTSRAGMAVGPPGPAPDVYDTIIASCSDETTPLSVGGPKTTFRAPYPFDMTNGYIRASLTNAVVGAALIIDITMNGTSVFSGNKLVIDDGSRTSVGSAVTPGYNFPGNAIPDDAEFLVIIDQIGSTYAGSGLKVALTGLKLPNS